MKLLSNQLVFDEVERIIATGSSVTLKVKGGSMRPYLRNEKDVVVISPFQPEELMPGVIVLFRYRDKHLLHRIIRIDNDELLIQGDGNFKACERVLKADVIGMVRSIIRPDGKPLSTHHCASRMYWTCWRVLRPLRRYLLKVYDLFS